MKIFLILFVIFFSTKSFSSGLHVFGLGLYDVKFDGSEDDQTSDFRYEMRLDQSIFNIGPEEDNFLFKTFLWF